MVPTGEVIWTISAFSAPATHILITSVLVLDLNGCSLPLITSNTVRPVLMQSSFLVSTSYETSSVISWS
eukprot:2858462-Heterocapsa_arctica.AAC.1